MSLTIIQHRLESQYGEEESPIHLVAAMGIITGSLKGYADLFKGDDCVSGPSKDNEFGGKTHPLFYLKPPIDITLETTRDPDLSFIVGESFDKPSLDSLTQRIIQELGFEPKTPTESFTQMIEASQPIRIEIYEQAKRSAHRADRGTLEDGWGVIQYTNFLTTYRDMDPKEAIDIATRQFGV